jgi:formylglycine-generating enzyme required for sulfatase activity
LATEYYLSHWQGDAPANEDLQKPVTNISYFAAQAYCRWFSSSVNLAARLPLESEWECVAKYIETGTTPSQFFPERGGGTPVETGINKNDIFAVKDIFGNVWEWCSNWFYPADSALSVMDPSSDERALSFTGAERVVRGGSWANSKADNIHSFTRGSQPPSWCTPYLGFRLALSE